MGNAKDHKLRNTVTPPRTWKPKISHVTLSPRYNEAEFLPSVSHRMLKVRHQQPTYNAVLYPLVVAVRPSTAQFLRQLRHFDVLVQSAEWNVDRLENKQAGPVNNWRAGRILCGE